MESLAEPPVRGGAHAVLFAGTPFKTTGWAGYEKHRQDDQGSGEEREKERSPKAHPPMGAAKSRKQAGDDVGENGCCHDLTATNSLSRLHCHRFTVTRLPAGRPRPSSSKVARRREALRIQALWRASRRGRGSSFVTRSCVLRTFASCGLLRLADLAAPRMPKHTLITSQRQKDYGDEVAVVELVLRPRVRDSHISFCALTNSR
jgi:hypothetical protein